MKISFLPFSLCSLSPEFLLAQVCTFWIDLIIYFSLLFSVSLPPYSAFWKISPKWSLLFNFKIFSMLLVFRSLIMMYFGMGFFGFVPFWIFLSSWICMFISFLKLGSFQPFLLWKFSTLFLFSFQNSDDMNIRYFVLFHRYLRNCPVFFQSILSLLFRLSKFY